MQLSEWLAREKITRTDLAALLGVTRVAVIHWCSLRSVPRRDAMTRLVAVTNGAVQPSDFFVDAANLQLDKGATEL